jgi:hypothetical protein
MPGHAMTDKDVGTFTIQKRSKTGAIWVPADLVRDSRFPLKPGKVKISIQGKRLIVEQ